MNLSLHKAWETLTQRMGPEILQGFVRPQTVYLFIFIFGCAGSLLLRTSFL